jgi:hypothetical protein
MSSASALESFEKISTTVHCQSREKTVKNKIHVRIVPKGHPWTPKKLAMTCNIHAFPQVIPLAGGKCPSGPNQTGNVRIPTSTKN